MAVDKGMNSCPYQVNLKLRTDVIDKFVRLLLILKDTNCSRNEVDVIWVEIFPRLRLIITPGAKRCGVKYFTFENMSLHVGKKYSTLVDWEQDLKSFECLHRQKYYKKNSRTLKAATPNLKKRVNSDLHYYEVQYSCIHGGKFQSRSNGIRNRRYVHFFAVLVLDHTVTGKYNLEEKK